MYRATVFILVLMLPAIAAAESVAVLPVSYKIYRTASQSEKRAAKTADAASRAVTAAGMTPVTGDAVENAVRTVSPSGKFSCTEESCLQAAAVEAGVDYAAAVAVVDSDGEFDIKVYVNGTEPATANHFGTFHAMIKRVEGMVESALKEAAEKRAAEAAEAETAEAEAPEPAPEAEPVATASEPEPTNEAETTAAEAEAAPPTPDGALNHRNRPISKAAFWSVFGITLGVGAAYGAVEGLGYAKWKDLEDDPDRTDDDEAAVDNLRLSSRILLGTLGAAVITTTVLAFFTDFKGKRTISAAPVFSHDQGGLMIQGEF